jgi:demethylmenaquinone methyltransferase/2-methoxy-6-polyprenyl-1,4-benzoquinol methylase
MTQNPESQWFGYKPVNPEDKTGMVHGVFDNVAGKYDIMNDLMSGGIHRLWKDYFVRQIRPRSGLSYLDVAGGTGDIAFRIRSKIPEFQNSNTPITICDLTEKMLEVGRNRAINRGWVNGFDWVTGNAETLPFTDNTYDVYTIAFGLRNVTLIDHALAEAYRVLKPGGRFYCLEFSHVRNSLLSKAYDLYSENVIPRIGALVANDRESYQYLVESIRQFPKQKELKRRLENTGFSRVTYTNLSAGIACIHTGHKF